MTTAGIVKMLGIDLFLAYLTYYFWDRGTRSGVVIAFSVLLLFLWFTIGGLTAGIRLSNGVVRVDIPFYGRDIPLQAIDRHDMAVVDLHRRPRLVPQWRTNGLGTRGFQLGWFHLTDGETALVALGDQHETVYLPTRKGYALLVSVTDPYGLMNAIRHDH